MERGNLGQESSNQGQGAVSWGGKLTIRRRAVRPSVQGRAASPRWPVIRHPGPHNLPLQMFHNVRPTIEHKQGTIRGTAVSELTLAGELSEIAVLQI